MTNQQIILQEQERLLQEGKITKNSNGEYEQLHTFQIWKKLGYSVKKGEHAITTLYIWKTNPKKNAKEVKEDVKEDEKNIKKDDKKTINDAPDFIKVKAFFFSLSQVQKANIKAVKKDKKEDKKTDTKKATTKKATTKKVTTKKATTKKATTKKSTTKKDKKVEEYEQITLCDEIIKDINRYAR